VGILFNTPFDKLVDDFKAKLAFKDDTAEGDVIAIVKEITPRQTAADYAQVVEFTADPTKKAEWWHVRLLFLNFPVVNVVFTLQAPHFTGSEIFTMGGKKVFIKALDLKSYREGREAPPEGDSPPEDGGEGPDDGGEGPGGPPRGRPTFTVVR
jgi:hypothetical protein